MNTKNIKYIGFYDIKQYENENRNSSLAGINKMNYIVNILNELEYKVTIVSPAWSMNNKGIYNKRILNLKSNLSLALPKSFGANNKLMRNLRVIYSYLWLFKYLMFNIKKNEEVIIYHSLGLIYPVLLAKKLKKIRIILEVEEIYQDVMVYSNKVKMLEYKMFEMADKYIFSTKALDKKLNYKKKPAIVINGAYNIENNITSKYRDNKIHLVYAGIIDSKKGGAISAVASAEYLSEKYHLHIIGFGSKTDINNLYKIIDEVSKKTKCKITYEGVYKDKEYIEFIQKCDIGLSTQSSKGEYIETSFPSKILSYLSNGLRVVSASIKSVKDSNVCKYVYFYKNDSSKEIAEAIKSIDLSEEYDSRKMIGELHKLILQDFKELLTK